MRPSTQPHPPENPQTSLSEYREGVPALIEDLGDILGNFNNRTFKIGHGRIQCKTKDDSNRGKIMAIRRFNCTPRCLGAPPPHCNLRAAAALSLYRRFSHAPRSARSARRRGVIGNSITICAALCGRFCLCLSAAGIVNHPRSSMSAAAPGHESVSLLTSAGLLTMASMVALGFWASP